MKKIRYTNLRLQQGNTEKVYEVEIIERLSREDARYLVNYRHGRLGAFLQEGSKTRRPVLLTEAEQLYNSVIVAQINKGYSVIAGDNPLADQADEDAQNTPEVQQVSRAGTSNHTTRQQTVFRQFNVLKDSRTDHKYYRCSRLIWRLGELEMQEAAPVLTDTLEQTLNLRTPQKHQLIRIYSLIWALGRCGDPVALPVVTKIIGATEYPTHIRRMAIQAYWHLLPATEQQQWLTTQYQTLPDSLRLIFSPSPHSGERGWGEGDFHSKQLAERLLHWAQHHKAHEPQSNDQSEIWFTLLYLQAQSDPILRTALIELCRTAPMEFGSVWLVRLFYKLAEFARDAELLGILIVKLDASAARYFVWGQPTYEQKTYQRTTRDYFKRRGWRLLRRLGQLGREDYVRIASAVLQQYDDKDSKTQTLRRYSWEGGFHTVNYHLPVFSNHITRNQVLYRHSSKYQSLSGGTYWHQAREEKEEQRSEAFPELWDAQPAAFIECMKHSRSAAVHEFALRGIRNHSTFLASVSVSDWVIIFCGPFTDSATYAQTQLAMFHSNALNDVTVLADMLQAETSSARALVHQQLDRLSDAQLMTAIDWHFQMIISPYPDNRENARTYHPHYPSSGDKQQLLLGKLVAHVEGFTTETLPEPEILQSISWSIREPLAQVAQTIDLGVVIDLLQHPLIEVQRLGADILVAREDNPADLPEDVFQALINSDDPELRAAGVNLLGNLDDTELLERHELLAALLISVDVPVRVQAKQLIAKLIHNSAQSKSQPFAQQVLAQLVTYAFHAEPVEDGHEELLQSVEQDLQIAWDNIDHAQLWRLLTARSRTAQRMGSILLQPRPSQSFSVQQWARLGKHISKHTRRWAWQAYSDNVERVQSDFTAGLRLLDTGWDDTRQFALGYFREHFSADDWTDEHLIFLCDSTRDDVQRLGRDLLREYFRAEQGESYLLKLSQHPARNVQLFATEFLKEYARGKPEVIARLQPYFITVLSAVNRGRVAKDRVLDFLLTEARQNAQVAEVLTDILDRQSVTVAIQDKGELIQAMLALSTQYPDLTLPLQSITPPMRGHTPKSDRQSEAA